jgi:hypothetical protein
MKQLKQFRLIKIKFNLILFFVAIATVAAAQDSVVNTPSVNIKYFVKNNALQYVIVQSRIKEGRKFNPIPKREVSVYLDSADNSNLLAKVITDANGEAECTLPPSLKDKWNSTNKHSFVAVMKGEKGEEEITSTLEITKAKIVIDTTNTDGTRSVNVKVLYADNNDWLPAKDVEMKVGINRDGAVLSAGDEATYTTDSTGVVNVELKKLSLPGDTLGNFMLVAKVEDNEQYGNLMIDKSVPWGIATKIDNTFFNQRTLWTTRFRTPFWLLLMAYSIVIGVWGTIIYLVMQIVKIKKLGVAAT